MIKALKDLKGSNKVDVFKEAYDIVEQKIQANVDVNMVELRRWFIYKMEQYYDTKLLGTQVVYCNNTFNKLKDKLKIQNNVELAKKITEMHRNYTLEYTEPFDFSKLNTNWLVDKLNTNSSYSIQNSYKINTENRRI